MVEEKVPNRWFFMLPAIVMQLCLGNLYTWSIFRTPLMKMHGWTVTEATVPFTLSIVFFAVAMIFAGRWQDKAGPKIVGMTGGVILGIGFLLASQIGTSLMGLYIAYGIIAGAGVGFCYVTPIALLIKWFPDIRGLMTGIAVMGFGAGSMIGAPLGTYLIGRMGVYGTFAVFGIAFGLLCLLSGWTFKNPPAGWKPAGWEPPAPAPGAKVVKVDIPPAEIMRYPQTYLLWFTFLMWASIGLMAISQAVPLGVELAGLDRSVAAAALGTMAIFNGLGRPAFGAISDKIGRRNATITAFVLYAVALLGFLPNATTLTIFTVGVCIVGFCYGGEFAVMPAFTADFYGPKNVGANYGIVFTAWGAAGILGPMIGAKVKAAYGTFLPAFKILTLLAVLGTITILITKKPVPKE